MRDDLLPVEMAVLRVDHDPIEAERHGHFGDRRRLQRHPQAERRLVGRELLTQTANGGSLHGGLLRGDGAGIITRTAGYPAQAKTSSAPLALPPAPRSVTMSHSIRRASLLAALLLAAPAVRAGTGEDLAFFESRIRPVLVEQCYSCHSAQAKKPKGKLLLDSRDGLRKGGESGPAIVLGDPDRSLLIRAVRHTDPELKMPPDKKLPASVIADLEAWVKRGAPDPRSQPAAPVAASDWDAIFKERRQWWSLQPVRKPRLPAVRDAAWSPQPIDRFILAGLETASLEPGGDADPRTLLRRLSLVLTGLPPTAQEADLFASAWAASAKRQAVVEQTVDRLLASPHFGERWARHWLDVVRFAETHGNEWNYEVHHAWRYRDYLIRAFNNDVPYDRLVQEHLAGDLLPPRWNKDEQINESPIGTAFWRFGEVNHDDCVEFRQIGYDLFDNQLDALGKTFLATTVACARCHDHKLDAISMTDYYALLGILRSSRLVSHTIDAPAVNEKPRQRLRDLNGQIRAELARLWLDDARSVGKYLLAAQAAIDKRPDAAALTKGLDGKRLEQWRKALVAKAEMDDVAQPWRALSKPTSDFAMAWAKLCKEYDAERRARAEFNAKNFVSFGDFRGGSIDGWQAAGQGLRDEPVEPGALAVDEASGMALYPAGLYTHLLSSKLNGTLRSPNLPAGKKYISFQVLGGKTAAVRLVSNNCQLDYIHYKALTKNDWSWIKLKIPADAASLRTYAELMTKFDNPKFPDQLGTLGGDTHNERVPWEKAAADPRSFFGITRAVVHDSEETPRAELAHLQPLFAGTPRNAEELAGCYAAVAESAVRAWADGKADDDAARWLDWLMRRGLIANDRKASPKLDALMAAYRAAEQELALPRIVPGIADAGDGFNQPVLARGDFNRPGTPVARRFLTMLETPDPTIVTKGSGRLELARRIAGADNPLTARVMVNRVWHHLFGAGLVRTVDDFGHLGEHPSHPELLDYLAATFVEDGWSIKKLIRRIVVSRTFQMTARTDAKARTADPDNRLLHHYPAPPGGRGDPRRDSRRLRPARPHPVRPEHRPLAQKANPDRRLFPGPLDGAGRRSLYMKVNLMEPPKFLGVFDFPGGKIPRGRRDVTNVPGQALALLNDPFVLQQADVWADRLVKQPDASVAARVEQMFLAALGRPPAPDERERFERFVTQLAELERVPPAGVPSSAAVWREVAHAMFNMREFITIP